jgi:hypothetical protein
MSGEFDMMRDKKQDLHFVNETFAVRIFCTDGTSCRFRAIIGGAWCNDPPFAVKERCFASRTQRKDWVMYISMTEERTSRRLW